MCYDDPTGRAPTTPEPLLNPWRLLTDAPRGSLPTRRRVNRRFRLRHSGGSPRVLLPMRLRNSPLEGEPLLLSPDRSGPAAGDATVAIACHRQSGAACRHARDCLDAVARLCLCLDVAVSSEAIRLVKSSASSCADDRQEPVPP